MTSPLQNKSSFYHHAPTTTKYISSKIQLATYILQLAIFSLLTPPISSVPLLLQSLFSFFLYQMTPVSPSLV